MRQRASLTELPKPGGRLAHLRVATIVDDGQEDFNFSNRTFPESGEAVTAVEVVRTMSGRLEDGTTRSAGNVVSASQWVNGWQVIVSSVGRDGGPPPATATEVHELLNQVALLLTE